MSCILLEDSNREEEKEDDQGPRTTTRPGGKEISAIPGIIFFLRGRAAYNMLC